MIAYLALAWAELWPILRVAVPWTVDVVKRALRPEEPKPEPPHPTWKDVEHVREQVSQATDPARWIPSADAKNARPGDSH